MSPDTAHVLPSKWKDFLREIDQLLGVAVEVDCLGGFVLSALYDLPRPTGVANARNLFSRLTSSKILNLQ